ncbi:CRE-UGT-12 protein [Caenorhabditis remanei]|uniref:glucuronosyltransferase n=1 Tax=Caenorhabditis remanei TaxID=31234 RepID=E3LK28_CAERE|nr:CRE-UGT-12 protein [Caenorhabditis remanei]
MNVKFLISVSLLVLFNSTDASKILIFNPIFGFSHVKFISKLADIIAEHGHNVTLFQPYHNAMKNVEGLVKNKNIEILNYYPTHYDELLKKETQTFSIFWDSQLIGNPVLGAFMLPFVLGGEFKKTSMEVLGDKNLINDLKERRFDVVMAETFELTGIYLAHLLDVPCIPMMSTVRYPIFNGLFGQPSFLGTVPQQGSLGAPEAGFLDRLNDIYRFIFTGIAQERLNKYQNDFIQEAIGRPVPNWKDLVSQSPIFITNSNPYLDYAVPTTAAIVHVGGITMNLDKMKNTGKLPEEYENILKERESTILLSFGSVIRSYEMPENFKAGIIQMFESLPDVTFIWKYEKDDVEFQKRLPKNVHLRKWVPQPALLADERVKVFVTHGGLGSIMEVAYSGKPAIVVPIFGDQSHNAMMLARHGGAVAYDKFDLQYGQKLAGVITELISNPKYKENAKMLLEVLVNQPIDPKINFLNHLDFAIKFPALRSQVPAIQHVGWIAHYYLDALVFLFILAIIFLYLLFKLLRRLLNRFIGKKPKNE